MTNAQRAEARRIWEKLRRWREHPVLMVREEFGTEPDPWQIEVLEAFPHNARQIMKACKGPGKTTVLAWLGLNFLATRPHPRINATSITGANLDNGLWPEFAKWMNRSEFFRNTFLWTKTAILHRQYPATWWARARTWPKKASAEEQAHAMAGLHEDYAMWLLDEIGGYPQSIMVTAEAVLLSGIETKVVGAGNPTHTTGPLYRACTVDRHLWHVTTITGDPDNPKAWVHSPRVNKSIGGRPTPADHAREQIKQYGRDNPWVKVNILGEFPPASINALLGVEEVELAMQRRLPADVYQHQQKRLGVDVARFGDDRTVIFPRQGLASFRPVILRQAKTTDIAARVMMASNRWGAELTLVDDTGHWGHGVIDNLTTANFAAVGINYAGKALDPRFKNRRAEFYVKGSTAIRNGAALPFLPEMVPELTEITYSFVNGQFILEEKAQLKERIGISPDLADAYMQTYAYPEMPGRMYELLSTGGRRVGRADHDFDPYADDERRREETEETLRALRDFDPNRI